MTGRGRLVEWCMCGDQYKQSTGKLLIWKLILEKDVVVMTLNWSLIAFYFPELDLILKNMFSLSGSFIYLFIICSAISRWNENSPSKKME